MTDHDETSDLSYDPYDVEIDADPYPVFRRLRDEAPLYYNEQYDFYALSRYDDVERGLVDRETYISGRGGILELIKAGIEMPPGILIFEDPPTHTMHRGLLSRVFTPAPGDGARAEDPRVLRARASTRSSAPAGFDFVADLGAQMPMRVIGMLLGIPEARPGGDPRPRRREPAHRGRRADEGLARTSSTATMFAELHRLARRASVRRPHDRAAERRVRGRDRHHAARCAARRSSPTSPSSPAPATRPRRASSAGRARCWPSTPTSAASWSTTRRCIPNAIEELLRFEPPAPHVGRYVADDVECHGTTVPEGSAMLLLVGAANRDDRRYPDGDRFDIHREIGQHLTFGYGAHFCLGAALGAARGSRRARRGAEALPGVGRRLVAGAAPRPTSTVRGWETLPVLVP